MLSLHLCAPKNSQEFLDVIAKEVWETLEIAHEGSQIVKASKIQILVSQFEEIRMKEEETFDEFYSKLSTIRNSTINLGKKMTDAKIIKKILRSLPTRFIPQIATITQSQDLETMRVKELVGSLQTFELLLPKPPNSKNLALKIKTTKGKSIDLFDDELKMMKKWL
jgi:vancomycin resistance protein YoaR